MLMLLVVVLAMMVDREAEKEALKDEERKNAVR